MPAGLGVSGLGSWTPERNLRLGGLGWQSRVSSRPGLRVGAAERAAGSSGYPRGRQGWRSRRGAGGGVWAD